MAALAIGEASPLVAADQPIQLTPDGTFRARDGRPQGLPGWQMDAAVATQMLTRLAARANPIVVDYEHQSLNAEANGQPAPAAGWIDPGAVSYRPGEGLVAAVRWTAKAAAMIDAREIAFVSPALVYDKTTGAVLDLHSVALTNTPAVQGMRPLAALAERLGYSLPFDPPEDTPMDLAALRSLLGLPDDADLAAIQQAVTALKTQADQVAPLTEQVAALKAAPPATPDPAAFVPLAVHQEALAALKRVGAETLDAELNSLIETGLAEGKIPGQATAEWLRGQGLAACRQYLADAPALAALKGTQTTGAPPAPAADTFTAALREEFGDEATWQAFRRAEEAGLVKMLTKES